MFILQKGKKKTNQVSIFYLLKKRNTFYPLLKYLAYINNNILMRK